MKSTRKWLNYIDGKWCDGKEHLDIINPANAQAIASIALASTDDAERALKAAQRSFKEGHLSQVRPIERSKILRRIANEIRNVADEGGEVLSLENGKPLAAAQKEFHEAAVYFDYYAGIADKISGRSIPLGDGYTDFTDYEPYGVSVQIIPWNFPISLIGRSLAPALTAGNSVVIKSSELTPLSSVILFEAIERSGIAKGLVNLLCGEGQVIGDYLTSHRLTNQITFTGSVKTGQAIMVAAAKNIVPTTMELGGKSAAVAFADVDMAQLVANVKAGIFFNSGQVCSAMSRLLVERSIYQQTLDKLKEMVEGLSIGAGKDNHDITPLLTEGQLTKVDELCQRAKAQGAKVLTGGNKKSIDGGYYFEPTVLYDMAHDSEIAQEEIFGPVICVMPFDDEQMAVNIANETRFGLANGVFTQNLTRALRVARQLDSGQVYVNEWFAGGVETPFGGNKFSGYGREKGQDAIYAYLKLKNTAIKWL